MKKRNKKKLVAILKHLDAGLVGVSKHTATHCDMIDGLNERVARLENAVGEALHTADMKKKKDLN